MLKSKILNLEQKVTQIYNNLPKNIMNCYSKKLELLNKRSMNTIKRKLMSREKIQRNISLIQIQEAILIKKILVIKKENGSIIINQQEIISETKKFCDNLYIRKDMIETEHIYKKNFDICTQLK